MNILMLILSFPVGFLVKILANTHYTYIHTIIILLYNIRVTTGG